MVLSVLGSARFVIGLILKFCVQNFHLLCPGSGDSSASDWAEVLCSRLDKSGDERAVAVLGWDRAVFLDWILPAPMAIFTM